MPQASSTSKQCKSLLHFFWGENKLVSASLGVIAVSMLSIFTMNMLTLKTQTPEVFVSEPGSACEIAALYPQKQDICPDGTYNTAGYKCKDTVTGQIVTKSFSAGRKPNYGPWNCLTKAELVTAVKQTCADICPSKLPAPVGDTCPDTTNVNGNYITFSGRARYADETQVYDGTMVNIYNTKNEIVGCGKINIMTDDISNVSLFNQIKVFQSSADLPIKGANEGEVLTFKINGVVAQTQPAVVTWNKTEPNQAVLLTLPGTAPNPIESCPNRTTEGDMLYYGYVYNADGSNAPSGLPIRLYNGTYLLSGCGTTKTENGKTLYTFIRTYTRNSNDPNDPYSGFEKYEEVKFKVDGNPVKTIPTQIYWKDLDTNRQQVDIYLTNNSEEVCPSRDLTASTVKYAGYIFDATNNPVKAGDPVRIYNSKNELIGCGEVNQSNGVNAYSMIYTYPENPQERWRGGTEGEVVSFTINGKASLSYPTKTMWSLSNPVQTVDLYTEKPSDSTACGELHTLFCSGSTQQPTVCKFLHVLCD